MTMNVWPIIITHAKSLDVNCFTGTNYVQEIGVVFDMEGITRAVYTLVV